MRLEYKPENENSTDNTTEKNEHVLSQGSTISDEIRNQNKKMKDKPFKEKLAYFLEYYKWPVVAAVLIIGVISSITYTIINSKESCFCAMIVNSANLDSAKLVEGFSSYAALDTKNYDCLIEANGFESPNTTNVDLSTSTRFAANLSTGELDVTIYDTANFNIKAAHDLYADLRNVLSSEEIEKYEPYFYYIDQEYLDAVNNEENLVAGTNVALDAYDEDISDVSSHMDKSAFKNPIPIGVIITDSNFIKGTNAYYGYTPVLGILKNSLRQDTAVAFLNYIFDENSDFSNMNEY